MIVNRQRDGYWLYFCLSCILTFILSLAFIASRPATESKNVFDVSAIGQSVRIINGESCGTGKLLTAKDGSQYILFNRFLIKDRSELTATLADGTVMTTDDGSDWRLLQIYKKVNTEKQPFTTE